jgi:hypothetical protein
MVHHSASQPLGFRCHGVTTLNDVVASRARSLPMTTVGATVRLMRECFPRPDRHDRQKADEQTDGRVE